MADKNQFRKFKQVLLDVVNKQGVMFPKLAQAHPDNFKATVIRAIRGNVSELTLNRVQSLDFASWPQKPNSTTLLHGDDQLNQPFGQMVAELFRLEPTLLAYCHQVEKTRRELRAQQQRQVALVTSSQNTLPTTTYFANPGGQSGGSRVRISFPTQPQSTSSPTPPMVPPIVPPLAPTSVRTHPVLSGNVKSESVLKVDSGTNKRDLATIKRLREANEQLQEANTRAEVRNVKLTEDKQKMREQADTRLKTEREQADTRLQNEKKKYEQLESSFEKKNAECKRLRDELDELKEAQHAECKRLRTEIQELKGWRPSLSDARKREGWTIEWSKRHREPYYYHRAHGSFTVTTGQPEDHCSGQAGGINLADFSEDENAPRSPAHHPLRL